MCCFGTGGVKNFLRILTSGELGVTPLEVTVFVHGVNQEIRR